MKTYLIAIGLLASLLATQTDAADAPNRPGPEHKKLEVWTGKWKLEESSPRTPFGPAGTASLRSEARFVNGGFHVEEHGKGRGSAGPYNWTSISYYDSDNRSYENFSYDSEGNAGAGLMAVVGNTWTMAWDQVAEGKKYQCKSVVVFADDGKSHTYHWSYSEDGVTWKPWLIGKATKVGKAK